MVVIPPPFFWPAAGALVLMLCNLTSTYRDRVTAQSGRPISELAIGT